MLYPNVMISTIDPAFSLTIYNASSSPYTLRIMTIVVLIFVPLILLYQGRTYWIFRKRVKAKPQSLFSLVAGRTTLWIAHRLLGTETMD